MLGPKLEPHGPRHVIWEGQEYLFFGGNDYHRFAFHPEVISAATEAAKKWGLNVSGSRTTSANHPIYDELESALAKFLDAEAAAVFSAGYISNTILMQAVADRFTHLLIDDLAHSSLKEAAAVSGLPVIRFEHRSIESLRRKRNDLPAAARPLVLTDGVFASTGDLAPLQAISELGMPAAIDDAHGLATVGVGGTGSWSECGVSRSGIFQTGTLSKGLGGFGGIVVADSQTIDSVKSKSSAFAGSTPMPIPMAAAALKSLELLSRSPSLIERLTMRSLAVKAELTSLGFRVSEGPSPICSVTFQDSEKNNHLFEILVKAGIYPNFINYPGCPPGGHFRFTMSSAHTDEDINRLLAAICEAVQFFNT